jgi:hypothetical protein
MDETAPFGRAAAPPLDMPTTAWPCRETAIDPIQNDFGLVLAVSKIVPWRPATGVPERFVSSYQRVPVRVGTPTVPDPLAIPIAWVV